MRERLVAIARQLAAKKGIDPDAFVQALSQPMGAFAQYEQDSDYTALLTAMNSLASGGSVAAAAATAAQPQASIATGGGLPPTTPPTQGGGDIPFEETPGGYVPIPPIVPGSEQPGMANVPEDVSRNLPSPTTATPGAPRTSAVSSATAKVNPLAQPPGMAGALADLNNRAAAKGETGVRSAAFGSLPLDQMNRYESAYHFPFFNEALGGATQAARNLAMKMGLSPQSGNPWSQYMESQLAPLANQAGIMALLNGQTDKDGFVLMDQITKMVQDAVQQGKTSMFGEEGAMGVIDRLKQLAEGPPGTTPGMLNQQEAMRDPNYVTRLIESMIGSTVAPGQRKYLPKVLDREMGGYYRNAPANPQLGPFSYLVGQMGR